MWDCGKTSPNFLGGASARPRTFRGRQLGRARVYRGQCAPCGAVFEALRGGANECIYSVKSLLSTPIFADCRLAGGPRPGVAP